SASPASPTSSPSPPPGEATPPTRPTLGANGVTWLTRAYDNAIHLAGSHHSLGVWLLGRRAGPGSSPSSTTRTRS
ncbi:hypothetical protein ACFQ1S_22585, partial [Kibdelosporangium lantanae]